MSVQIITSILIEYSKNFLFSILKFLGKARNYIILIIFEVEGSKYIFCKIYSTLSIFCTFFISTSHLSILFFHKKLKLIDLQLELNH